MALELFDYIGSIFGSEKEWQKIKNYDKKRHSFLLNRFMSIKFPIQGSLFNDLKANPVTVADIWRSLGSKFKFTPSWIYTKTKKKPKINEWTPNTDTVNEYLVINNIGKREFSEAIKFGGEKFKSEFNRFEKQVLGGYARKK